ncbi:ferredoxin [Nocardia tengchongensis]|uniref:Ferredoxin n=1 Tax=Nocardia tengchongensis TaxID=2055889 RepID=A0ABX8CHQ4_9NOCA|nr:ferredoxin [Nocardia tengchongensis]QVI19491.1 ferredoxin [Nocardia tengchongensis]
MKIELDRNRCEGHAMCEAAAPRFFSVDDEGDLTILQEEVSESEKSAVNSAVISCPVAALKLLSP